MSALQNPPARILLTRLPPLVVKALQEQWQRPHMPPLHIDIEETFAENLALPYDLVICGDEAPLPATTRLTPATPRLDIAPPKRHRLGVILRQARQMLEEPALYLDGFKLGRYFFDPSEKLLAVTGSADVALTDKEVDILIYLARHHAAPVSRDDLLKNVWRYQKGVDTHTLETHIYRLRQKIEETADTPRLLVTEETGYRLIL